MENVAIIGAQGYSGRELARLILHHPKLQLGGVFTTQKDWHLSSDLPESQALSVPHYEYDTLLDKKNQFDGFFLATPPSVSMSIAPQLLEKNKIVIDLSGAFRLPVSEFQQWYGMEHIAPQYIEQAIYGISPWWKNTIGDNQQGMLIANPGCFATCALMSLLPIIKAGMIKTNNIMIDAKSGATGAGRGAKKYLQFCELANNFFPYKIGAHQHIPEITQCLHSNIDLDAPLDLDMITNLLPLKRGIAMGIYCELNDHHNTLEEISQQVNGIFETYYGDYPLVRYSSINYPSHHQLCSQSEMPIVSLKHVVGSSRIHIGYYIKDKKLFLFSSIDNLLKGAASQAIENYNHCLNLPIDTGLTAWEGTL